MRSHIALVALALLLVACGGTGTGGLGATPPPPPTPVPWLAADAVLTPRPQPSVPPPPAGVPDCTAAELRLAATGGTGGGGWWVRAVVLTTAGTRPCLVRGPVATALRDGDGPVIEGAISTAPSWSEPGWAVLAPGEPFDPLTRRPGQGQLTLTSYGDCARATFDAVTIGFVGPVTAVAHVTRQPVGGRCDSPGQVLRLHVSLLGPAEPLALPTVPPMPLAARIEAPAAAFAGETLRFVVWLRTTAAASYDWRDGCPDYLEWLGGHPVPATDAPGRVAKPEPPAYAGATKERHPLNCAAAGPLLPGSERAFEMRIAVPPDARGTDTLRWDLPYAGAPDAATARIEVLPPRR
jgi:hypothetical protein